MREGFTQRQGKRLRLGVALLPSVFLPSLSHALVAATETYQHLLSFGRALLRFYIFQSKCFARFSALGDTDMSGGSPDIRFPQHPFPLIFEHIGRAVARPAVHSSRCRPSGLATESPPPWAGGPVGALLVCGRLRADALGHSFIRALFSCRSGRPGVFAQTRKTLFFGRAADGAFFVGGVTHPVTAPPRLLAPISVRCRRTIGIRSSDFGSGYSIFVAPT